MARFSVRFPLRAIARRLAAPLGIVAALCVPTPAHAFVIERAAISPTEIVIPCPGTAKIFVAIGGTVGNVDLTLGHIATRLVITGFTDTLLANMSHPLRPGDLDGSYVSRCIEVEVKCDGACRIILADGTAGPTSADVAVEGTAFGSNYGEIKISCRKGAPVVQTVIESGTTVAAGVPLEYSTVLYAAKKPNARSLRGTAVVTLARFNEPQHVQTVQQFNFRDLRQGLIGSGVVNTAQLPPGIYRLLLTVRNQAGKQIGAKIRTFEVTPPPQ